MITQNLTPFNFGAKVTSRVPGQLEMTALVRGTFRLSPGQALTQIEDPIEQGFMTADVFADDDEERAGAPSYASDFADWKPRAEVLVRGSAYPPGGPATECTAGVSVGAWKKQVVVLGPRAWRERLIGATPGESVPFERMPLTYANAWGGPGYAQNPVGKGYGTGELPTVELLGQLVTGQRATVSPASFMPINPLWPQRAKKRGTKYGTSWRQTRSPFFAEDFDWTYFNAAPEDQQLQGYLRGDEALAFENMHPTQSWWETQLPGLRLRVFVKNDRDEHAEVRMHLDTLFADLEEGRLYLTWRGLTRVREMDLSDVAAALVASEPLADPPLRAEHYREQLDAFVQDPLGLEEEFDPGFLEMAKRIEEEEAAELAGTPVPLEERVDPFGIRADLAGVSAAAIGAEVADAFPPGFLDLAQALEEGHVPVPPGLEGREELEGLAETELLALHMTPAEQREQMLEGLTQPDKPAGKTLFEAFGTSLAIPAKLLMPPSDEPLEDPRPELEALSAELQAKRARLEEQGVTSPLLGLLDQSQRQIAASIALATSMLDAPRAHPPGPDLGPVRELLDKGKQELLSGPAGPDTPKHLAKIDEASEKLDELERAFPFAPDPGLGEDARDFAQQDLRGRDFSEQELAGKSFAGANLGQAKFSGANLAGAVFAGANLSRADLSGATLDGARLEGALLGRTRIDGASLVGAVLTESVLVQASLTQADLSGARLDEAVLEGANLAGARLVGASLRETNLKKANLEGADLSQARGNAAVFEQAQLQRATLVGAVLTEADFSGAYLSGANLTEAHLVEANFEASVLIGATLTSARLESARFEEADLRRAKLDGGNLRFAVFTKSCLEGASLRGADLSMAELDKVRADGVDLSEARLEMTSITKARLRGATLRGTKGVMASFEGSDLQGCDARGADLSTCDLGEAILEGADLSGANLEKASFRTVRAAGAKFVEARVAQAVFSMGADFTDADFNRVEGSGSIWQAATLDRTNFAYAQLSGSQFQGAKGTGTRFDAARLKEASFRKATLKEAVFNLADLCHANLTHTGLLDVSFQSANCYSVKLLFAQMAGCDFDHANVDMAVLDEGVTL